MKKADEELYYAEAIKDKTAASVLYATDDFKNRAFLAL